MHTLLALSVVFTVLLPALSWAITNTSPWPAIRRACEQISERPQASCHEPGFSNCNNVDPGVLSFSRINEVVPDLLRTMSSSVLERAVANCNRELTRLNCQRVRNEVEGDKEALARLRTCDEKSICEEAKARANPLTIGRASLSCARNIAVGLLDLVRIPGELIRANAECNADSEGKLAIINVGPWMQGIEPEMREGLARSMTCAQLRSLRKDRIENYIRKNRLTLEAFRAEMEKDGTLSADEIEAVIGSVSGLSASDVSNMATNVWEKMGSPFHEVACYNFEAQTEMFCEGAAGLASGAIGPAATARIVEVTRNSALAQRLGRTAQRTGLRLGAAARGVGRGWFVERYMKRWPTSTSENARWIARAESAVPGGSATFFNVENAFLKTLNTTFDDKNTVTAMTNFYQEIITRRVSEYVARHKHLEIERYSDYKSSRFAFSGVKPATLDSDLAKIFEESNDEFHKFLIEGRIIRVDDKTDWFRAGIGATDDEANTAARLSRSQEGKPQLERYANSNVQEALSSRLSLVERERQDLQSRLPREGLMERVDGLENTYVPSRATIEAVRKGADDNDILERLKRLSPANNSLSQNEVQALKRYVERIDEFSPGLRIAQRETASLNLASEGGLSIDFAGMGTYNQFATAQALARSKNLNQALQNARSGEMEVTQLFNQRKTGVSRTVLDATGSKATCSGDDCVFLAREAWSPEDRLKIVQNLAANHPPASIRASFIRNGIRDPDTRSQLAVHGELIESKLRKKLVGSLPQDTLDNVLFAIDMDAQTLGQGHVQILIGKGPRSRLTAEQETLIRRKLAETVREHNENISGSYQVR